MTLAELANARQLQAVQTKVVADYLLNDPWWNVRHWNPTGTPNGTTMTVVVNKFDDEQDEVELRQFGSDYTENASIATPESYYLYPVGKGFYDDKALSRGLREGKMSKWIESQTRQAINATKKRLAKYFIDGATGAQGNIVGLKGITTAKGLTFDDIFDGTIAPSMEQAQAFLAFFNKAKAQVPHCNSIECSKTMGALLETYGAMLNQYTTEVVTNAAMMEGQTASTSYTIKKFAGIPIVTYDNVDFTVGDGVTEDTFEEFYLVYNSEEDGICLGIPDYDDEIVHVSLPVITGGRAIEGGFAEILTQVIDMTKKSVVRVTGYQIFDVA